jgi:hypothetical protein
MTISCIVLISLYVISCLANRSVRQISTLWGWSASVRVALGRLSLISATLGAFSFVAGSTVDGPMVELTELHAKALSDYREIIWQVELTLRSELGIRVADQAFGSSPASVRELAVSESFAAPLSIPAVYYKNGGSSPMTAEQLIAVKDPLNEARQTLSRQASAALEKEYSSKSWLPPADATLDGLQKVSNEALRSKFASPEQVPVWMTGIGPEVFEKTVALVLSSDRIPLLKLIAERTPIAGKLIDIVVEAIDGTVSSRVEEAAKEIVKERMDGKIGTLQQGIAERVTALIQYVHPAASSESAWAPTEVAEHSVQIQTRAAQSRFEDDIEHAIVSKTAELRSEIERFQKLAPGDGSGDLRKVLENPQSMENPALKRLHDSLESEEISLEKLKAVEKARGFAERRIGLYAANPSHLESAERILGDRFSRYWRIGLDIQMESNRRVVSRYLLEEKPESEGEEQAAKQGRRRIEFEPRRSPEFKPAARPRIR